MTTLSSFTPEEADLIISLPYRVGMNVSYSEDESGELDDTMEVKALESVLRKVPEDAGFVKDVAVATLAARDKWGTWSQGVFNIEPLCENAVTALRTQAGQDEIKGYVAMCLQVAEEVARAYGEFGEDYDGSAGETSGIIGKIIEEVSKLVPGVKGQEANHPMNISAAEDSAIDRIREAMKKALA